jgi:hypothetical protein
VRHNHLSIIMFKFNKHHSNSTHYQPNSHPTHTPVSSNNVLENNQLGQYLEVGKLVTTAGPENIWKVYDGWRKVDGKVCIYGILYFPHASSICMCVSLSVCVCIPSIKSLLQNTIYLLFLSIRYVSVLQILYCRLYQAFIEYTIVFSFFKK